MIPHRYRARAFTGLQPRALDLEGCARTPPAASRGGSPGWGIATRGGWEPCRDAVAESSKPKGLATVNFRGDTASTGRWELARLVCGEGTRDVAGER